MTWALPQSSWRFWDSFNSMQSTIFSQNIRHCWTMHFLFIWFKSFINHKVLSVSGQAKLKKALTKSLWRAEKKELYAKSEIKQKQNSHLSWSTMCSILRFNSEFSVLLPECALRWSSQRTYDEKMTLQSSIEDKCYPRSVSEPRIKTRSCFHRK